MFAPKGTQSQNRGLALRKKQAAKGRDHGPSQNYDSPGSAHFLERYLGNSHLQAKLILGPVGDKYEQEADRVATHVVQQRGAVKRSGSSGSEGESHAQVPEPLADRVVAALSAEERPHSRFAERAAPAHALMGRPPPGGSHGARDRVVYQLPEGTAPGRKGPIQRNCGFELEWQSAALYKLKNPASIRKWQGAKDVQGGLDKKRGGEEEPKKFGDPYYNKDIILVPPSRRWDLTSDGYENKPYIEFRVPPKLGFPLTDQGEGDLSAALDEIKGLYDKVIELARTHEYLHVQTVVSKVEPGAEDVFIDARLLQWLLGVQVTAGIPLKHLFALLQQVAEEPQQESGAALLASETTRPIVKDVVANLSAREGEFKHQPDVYTSELKGLVAQAATVVSGMQRLKRQTNVKQRFVLLHRTDMAAAFANLPPQSRDHFAQAPDLWANLVCKVADQDKDKELVEGQQPTNSKWLMSFVGSYEESTGKHAKGEDLLTEVNLAIGGLGERMDQPPQGPATGGGTGPSPAPIFEFRYAEQTGGPRWKEQLQSVFSFMRSVEEGGVAK